MGRGELRHLNASRAVAAEGTFGDVEVTFATSDIRTCLTVPQPRPETSAFRSGLSRADFDGGRFSWVTRLLQRA